MPAEGGRMKREPLEKAEITARKIGKVISKSMPKGWGFVVALFSYGDNGLTTYLSNCEREGIIKAMREIADKIENNEPEV